MRERGFYFGLAGALLLLSNGETRPVAEYERMSYLFFSSNRLDRPELSDLKQVLFENAPTDVKVVVYTGDESRAVEDLAFFQSLDRVGLRDFPSFGMNGSSVWARDALPIPIFDDQQRLHLIDARYSHGTEPDTLVETYLQAPRTAHSHYFEGGNFLADTRGRCFISDTQYTRLIPDVIFLGTYTCTEITRVPYIRGIGHIDERIKFLSDSVAITDQGEYVALLEEKGFTVKLLPRPQHPSGTYINSLLINGLAFVPSYSEGNDATVNRIYEEEGFRVINIDSREVSNLLGSIHCMTMTYP